MDRGPRLSRLDRRPSGLWPSCTDVVYVQAVQISIDGDLLARHVGGRRDKTCTRACEHTLLISPQAHGSWAVLKALRPNPSRTAIIITFGRLCVPLLIRGAVVLRVSHPWCGR